MNVSEIMTRDPVTIRSTDTLRAALEAMERANCHHLPVLSADRHLVGVITARDCRQALRLPDISRNYWNDADGARGLLVRSVMTPAGTTITPEADAAEAARLMLRYYVSCLPVMREETLVGIVTTSDILVAFTKLSS